MTDTLDVGYDSVTPQTRTTMWGWFGGEEEKKEEEPQDVPITVAPSVDAATELDDCKALHDEVLAKLEKWAGSDDGWEIIDERDGFELYEMKLEDFSFPITKVVGTLPVNAHRGLEIVMKTDVEFRKQWDEQTLKYDVVKTLSTPGYSMEITYMAFTAPFPVQARDFCAIRCSRTSEDGPCLVWGRSITHESLVPPNEEHVRGNALMSGFLFTPVEGDPSKCTVVAINHVDPCGWIPTFVINMAKGKSLDRIIKLAEMV